MCPEPRARRARSPWLCVLGTALLLSACAAPTPRPDPLPPPPPSQPKAPPAPAPAPLPPAPAPAPAEAAVAMPVYGGLPGAVRSDSDVATAALLERADKLRRMPPPELAQEVQRLSEIPDNLRQPSDDMQLALALSMTRVPADLARAQALLQRVLANTRDEGRGLHPLAALLAARHAEQRRLEDLLDKQAQQLREQQRRIDQLNERLEAVRAIERSLTSRPAPAVPASGATRPPGP